MDRQSMSVTEEVTIKARAERVFDALTDPQQRVKWWGSEGRFRTQHMESDLRPGGRWMMSGIGVGGRPFHPGRLPGNRATATTLFHVESQLAGERPGDPRAVRSPGRGRGDHRSAHAFGTYRGSPSATPRLAGRPGVAAGARRKARLTLAPPRRSRGEAGPLPGTLPKP